MGVLSDGGCFAGGGDGAVRGGGDEFDYSLSKEGFVGYVVPDVEYLDQDGVNQELVFPLVRIPGERDDSIFERAKVYIAV